MCEAFRILWFTPKTTVASTSFVARRGDHHFLGAALQMRGGFGLAGEQPGAFQHHVGAHACPSRSWPDRARRTHGCCRHSPACSRRPPTLARELAVGGVVFGEVRVGGGIAQIVDGDDLDLAVALALIQGPQDIAADAAVTVDAYLDASCHSLLPQHSMLRCRILHKETMCFLQHSVSVFSTRFLVTASTVFTTLSTVKPKYSNTSFAGADSP